MKWKISKESSPVMGDKRTELKWAWFPVRATSQTENQDYWVWMDWYTRTEEYMRYLYLMPGCPSIPVIGWRTIKCTVDTTEYIGKKW